MKVFLGESLIIIFHSEVGVGSHGGLLFVEGPLEAEAGRGPLGDVAQNPLGRRSHNRRRQNFAPLVAVDVGHGLI